MRDGFFTATGIHNVTLSRPGLYHYSVTDAGTSKRHYAIYVRSARQYLHDLASLPVIIEIGHPAFGEIRRALIRFSFVGRDLDLYRKSEPECTLPDNTLLAIMKCWRWRADLERAGHIDAWDVNHMGSGHNDV